LVAFHRINGSNLEKKSDPDAPQSNKLKENNRKCLAAAAKNNNKKRIYAKIKQQERSLSMGGITKEPETSQSWRKTAGLPERYYTRGNIRMCVCVLKM